MNGPLDVGSVSAVPTRVPRIFTPLFSALKPLARMLLPVSGVLAAPSCSLVARPGDFRCSGELCDCTSSPGSSFLSISEYLSRFLDSLDGQRLATVVGLSAFN